MVRAKHSGQSSVLFFYFRGGRRDSISTGLHGIVWAGLSTHGTSQDGARYSRDSMAYFGQDAVFTGLHGTEFNNNGTSRDVLRGIQQPPQQYYLLQVDVR